MGVGVGLTAAGEAVALGVPRGRITACPAAAREGDEAAGDVIAGVGDTATGGATPIGLGVGVGGGMGVAAPVTSGVGAGID